MGFQTAGIAKMAGCQGASGAEAEGSQAVCRAEPWLIGKPSPFPRGACLHLWANATPQALSTEVVISRS